MTTAQNPGEDKAWDILSSLQPDGVCTAALVSYEAAASSYALTSFGMNFLVSTRDRTISADAPGSEILLGKLGYFFRLSVLWYLVRAKEIACSGRPVKLENIPGGDIFTRGSHVLPLDSLAQKYGHNKGGFLERGGAFGAEPFKRGDAAIRFFPLPRVPAILTLWLEDEEFPARVDITFDSTCELQLPTDIVWSIAMMTVLVML